MKHLKIIGLAAVAAMALMAFAAGSASATTLEIGGETQKGGVEISASIAPGGSAILEDTNKLTQDTCTASTAVGTTTTITAASVGGPISSLTFSGCTHTTHVLANGSLSVSRSGSPTNGTVTSAGAEVTVKSTVFGVSIVCKTGTGTDIGTLTGVPSGHATMDINAVVNCGSFVPTAKWTGTYTVTSPTGLGVVG
jgi:hypothetical protein